ncbi:MAG: YihY family inner membrane protein [Xylophilus ampelinus]
MRARLESLRDAARRRLGARGAQFPWRTTAQTLAERFREDRIGLTASSLTFTTVVALVPLFTVALAVFTAFPMFAEVQRQLQRWLFVSLVPDTIARQVLGYLTQFASKASSLGAVGLSVLLATALALILTIDRTLNNIWRVRRPRPLGQRLLIYWASLTLGPLVLGSSLTMTSLAVGYSRSALQTVPGGLRMLLDAVEFMLLAGGMAALYHFVPNTLVKWRHAWTGGIFVAVCMEGAKKLLGLYLGAVPTYSVLYGAFATLPILLVWIYVAWLIVLLGAVVAAYLPSLLAGVGHRAGTPGWQFALALDALRQLREAGRQGRSGLTAADMGRGLRIDPLQLEPVLDALVRLDWIGRLREQDEAASPRHVLLVDPEAAPLAPLLDRLLLPASPPVAALWSAGGWHRLRLSDALAGAAAAWPAAPVPAPASADAGGIQPNT